MRSRHAALLAALAIIGSVGTAAAGPRLAYIDEVAVFGGAEEPRVRAFVDATVTRGGLRAQFAGTMKIPCGNDPACLMDRTRAAGAVVGLRVTVAEIAGGFVAAVLIVDVDHRDTRREIVEGIDLARPDDRLVGALRVHADTQRRPRYAAWSLAVGAGVLAIGGSVATWRARDLRSEFFANHVAPNGDVIGISPMEARAAEQRAQRWSLAGGILLVVAAASGLGATVLFVTEGGVGVAVAGTL